jgi:hypothetical protein
MIDGEKTSHLKDLSSKFFGDYPPSSIMTRELIHKTKKIGIEMKINKGIKLEKK